MTRIPQLVTVCDVCPLCGAGDVRTRLQSPLRAECSCPRCGHRWFVEMDDR